MSRRARGLPRARMISDDGLAWIKAGLGGLMVLAFMAAIILLEIEFPDGLPSLHDLQFSIVASDGK